MRRYEKTFSSKFRKLSKDTAVWEREDRYWRMREPNNKPGTWQRAELGN
jgi:hypothetical protein